VPALVARTYNIEEGANGAQRKRITIDVNDIAV
jgi:hypothetical protein